MKISILIILFCFNIYSQYVTKEELETGWNIYWLEPQFQELPMLNTYLTNLRVSPNEKYLSFNVYWYEEPPTAHNRFVIYDIEKKNIIFSYDNLEKQDDAWVDYSTWAIDSKYFFIVGPKVAAFNFVNVETLEENLININCPSDSIECYIGRTWNIKNEICCFSEGLNFKNQAFYKMIFLESLYSGKTVYIKDSLINYSEFLIEPIYANSSANKFIIGRKDHKEYNYYNGFYIFQNNNLIDSVNLILPNNEWKRRMFNNYNYSAEFSNNDILFGNDDDLYFYQSFSRKDDGDYPWSEVELEARNASGIYRMDLTGDSLIQLTRDWNYNTGGLSMSSDGETIYYGTIGLDTNSVIKKMNKFGKEKEIVLNLGDIRKTLSVKVNSNSDLKFEQRDDIIYLEKLSDFPINVNLADINGRILQEIIFEGNKKEININYLSRGLYLVSFPNSDFKTIKFIVE